MDELRAKEIAMLLLRNPDEHFTAWLMNKLPDDIVGRSKHCEQCPIAMFLRANGLPDAKNGAHEVRPLGHWPDRSAFNQPEWVRDFVREIDNVGPSQSTPVTAAMALTALSTIKAHTAQQEETVPTETTATEPAADPWQNYLDARKRLAHLQLEAAIIREDVEVRQANLLDKKREHIEKIAEVRQAEVARANAHDALSIHYKSIAGGASPDV